MYLNVLGQFLPGAMAIALSPFPVVAVVVLLTGRSARTAGPAFAAGWTIGLSLLSALVVWLSSGAEDSYSAQWVSATRIAIGAGLLVLAVKKWVGRPRGDEEPVMPGWMAVMDTAGPSQAFGIGLALGGVNPKHVAITSSAASIIGEAHLVGGQAVTASVVFVLLSSFSVLGSVAFFFVGGDRSQGPLGSLRRFMVANTDVLIVAVLLMIGVNILGDGISGLG